MCVIHSLNSISSCGSCRKKTTCKKYKPAALGKHLYLYINPLLQDGLHDSLFLTFHARPWWIIHRVEHQRPDAADATLQQQEPPEPELSSAGWKSCVWIFWFLNWILCIYSSWSRWVLLWKDKLNSILLIQLWGNVLEFVKWTSSGRPQWIH